VTCTTAGRVREADSPPTLSHPHSFKTFTEETKKTVQNLVTIKGQFLTMRLPNFKMAVFGIR